VATTYGSCLPRQAVPALSFCGHPSEGETTMATRGHVSARGWPAPMNLAGRWLSGGSHDDAVADDELILSFLGRLPAAKRQPNLLFGAARHLLGFPPIPEASHSLVAWRGSSGATRRTEPSTRSNEPLACGGGSTASCAIRFCRWPTSRSHRVKDESSTRHGQPWERLHDPPIHQGDRSALVGLDLGTALLFGIEHPRQST
jgi:hypothetical protein